MQSQTLCKARLANDPPHCSESQADLAAAVKKARWGLTGQFLTLRYGLLIWTFESRAQAEEKLRLQKEQQQLHQEQKAA